MNGHSIRVAYYFRELAKRMSMSAEEQDRIYYIALTEISKGARYHHERYDGSSYCEGFQGSGIPLVARFIGVADSYDAMSSASCYRRGLDKDVIISELTKGRGLSLTLKLHRLCCK